MPKPPLNLFQLLVEQACKAELLCDGGITLAHVREEFLRARLAGAIALKKQISDFFIFRKAFSRRGRHDDAAGGILCDEIRHAEKAGGVAKRRPAELANNHGQRPFQTVSHRIVMFCENGGCMRRKNGEKPAFYGNVFCLAFFAGFFKSVQ